MFGLFTQAYVMWFYTLSLTAQINTVLMEEAYKDMY